MPPLEDVTGDSVYDPELSDADQLAELERRQQEAVDAAAPIGGSLGDPDYTPSAGSTNLPFDIGTGAGTVDVPTYDFGSIFNTGIKAATDVAKAAIDAQANKIVDTPRPGQPAGPTTAAPVAITPATPAPLVTTMGLPTAAIVGIGVGATALLGFGIYAATRRRRRRGVGV